ncbi:MAG: Slp/YeaY family lipoprotein [Pseudomonadota bacterium]
MAIRRCPFPASARGWPSRLPPLLMLLAMAGGGCATTAPITPSLKSQAVPVDFARVTANPDQFKGQTVILGGQVVSAEPTTEGTLLTMLETKTDDAERPQSAETSRGRFMALYKGFLDPQIYAKGRQVTVAGQVEGSRLAKVGQLEYRYPYIMAEQVYLWPRPDPAYYYAPYGYGAYWPYGPYFHGPFGPWWWW